MKKKIFSAIVMIAFSGVSMANDIAEKETKIVVAEKEVNSKEEALGLRNCDVAKFSAYVDARAAGFSQEQANSLSWQVYFFCVSENAKDLSIGQK